MANKRKQILTPEADKQLVVAFTTCKDGEMRTRIQAVRLYGNEVPVNEITNLTGLPRRTILRWYGRYRQQGLGGFVDNRQGGNHQYLTDEQIQDLAAKLHQYRPVDLFGQKEAATADGLHWCISDLRRAINHWYGIDYKRNASYRQLFQKCGFSWQRTAKVFRSRSEMKVAEFEEQLEKK
ncbi:MAG TPA: helix-turn-helix domain-containing protein [Chitinophagales bacterium]|nr:helix-turn-helix domain-containing protein [Ardenticatenaceae bacterium]MCB8980084.1 helix-turn-helix domain-containing protein [Ardenticatenaceae bacterium]MCB8980365.1 helix-turn-helix domain-containing protein [Ardenticatenaceae bacterium]HQU41002.1 helix-turn-helix domain-containing protein [Chitinophagales bacterium]